MACFRARVFSRRCSSFPSSPSISLSTVAMAVCSGRDISGMARIDLDYYTFQMVGSAFTNSSR